MTLHSNLSTAIGQCKFTLKAKKREFRSCQNWGYNALEVFTNDVSRNPLFCVCSEKSLKNSEISGFSALDYADVVNRKRCALRHCSDILACRFCTDCCDTWEKFEKCSSAGNTNYMLLGMRILPSTRRVDIDFTLYTAARGVSLSHVYPFVHRRNSWHFEILWMRGYVNMLDRDWESRIRFYL